MTLEDLKRIYAPDTVVVLRAELAATTRRLEGFHEYKDKRRKQVYNLRGNVKHLQKHCRHQRDIIRGLLERLAKYEPTSTDVAFRAWQIGNRRQRKQARKSKQ